MVEPYQPGCHLVLSRAVPLNSSANFRFHVPERPTGLGGAGAGAGADTGAGDVVVVLVGAPGTPATGGGTVQPTTAMAARLRTGRRRRESTRALSAGRKRRRWAKRVVRILGKVPSAVSWIPGRQVGSAYSGAHSQTPSTKTRSAGSRVASQEA